MVAAVAVVADVTARRFTDDELRAIYADPRTLQDIGASLDPPIGQSRLSQMLKRLGLPTRPRVGKYRKWRKKA